MIERAFGEEHCVTKTAFGVAYIIKDVTKIS